MILNDIKLNIDEDLEVLKFKVLKQLKLSPSDLKTFKLIKKSVDARDKNDIHFVCSVAVNELAYERIIPQKIKSSVRPIVCGFGPAGMFAALYLSLAGLKPIVLERGDKVEIRKGKVDDFWKTGNLDLNTNVQFGEGGAGTFSDGKLTTGINNPLCNEVIKIFIENGAPCDIEYLGKPHIGTDNLSKIVKNIRETILALDGEIFFNTKLSDIEIKNNGINKIISKKDTYTSPILALATGHSARDTYKMLFDKNVMMQQKFFSVGFRIEHRQNFIDKAQYGKFAGHENLPAAEYKFSYHDNNDNNAYTFCMCPGGFVVASSSFKNTVVTNGMSAYDRNGENANSAVLVNVDQKDFKSFHPLAGIDFQETLEEKAFIMAGSNYSAPCQLFGDFLNNCQSNSLGEIKPTYTPSVSFCNLNELFSERINKTLKTAVKFFGNKLKGFDDKNAILTAPETRSSSPVKILRDNGTLQSNIKGLYPCGEGSGYSGGIMSSAVDGLKVALKIIEDIKSGQY